MDNSAHPNSPNEQSIQTRKPNETDSLSSNESKLTSEHETTTSSSSDETDEKQTFTRNKHSENENNGDEDVHKDKLAKGRQRKVHKRKKKSSKSKQQIESNPNPASSSDQSNEVGKGTSENKDTTTEPSKDEKDFTEAQEDSSKATATAQSPAVKPTLSIEVVQEPDTKPTLRRPSRGGGPKRLKSKTRNGRRNPLMMPKPVEPPPPPPAPPPAPVEPEKPTTENTEETKEVVAPLPVVKTPINICVREDWRARATKYPKDLEVEETALKLPAVGVVFITNTEVDECKSWAHCAHEVRKIQNYHMDVLGLKDIAYNWLIGGDMTVFEGLGWDRRGPAASNTEVNKFLGHDVYIGFLGQYTAETIPLNTLHHALAFIHLSMPTYIAEEYNTHVYDSLEILDDKNYDFVQDI
ncbi:eukaryotic translation initiation factor 5B-like [Macrosteles quadrilineatus]|uniref:eukaryotic translation initiation factor 5B-like n=1 Tax=Macrosteles quadrilineatus TaxID=74068 RepID=UPI0023E0B30E|nr:eukaryotic translation initiation factor 5B-like [Macrosteles quadrilineatus]